MSMSLDDYESEQREIITVVKNNPACNKDLIYNKLNLEKHTLALLLHKLIQLGDIYKKNDKYYSVDVSPEALAEMDARVTAAKVEKVASRIGPTSPALQQKPAEVANVAAALVVEKEKKETVDNRKKLYGCYHRTGDNGKVAMFFYQNRDNGIEYSAGDVQEALKTIVRGNIRGIVHNFSSAGILTSSGERRIRNYKWSGKLIYPFSSVLPDDRFIIPEVLVPKTPKSESVIAEPVAVPTTALAALDTGSGDVTLIDDKVALMPSQSNGNIQNIVTKCESPALAITMIDLRIEAISAELNNLTVLRNIIVGQK